MRIKKVIPIYKLFYLYQYKLCHVGTTSMILLLIKKGKVMNIRAWPHGKADLNLNFFQECQTVILDLKPMFLSTSTKNYINVYMKEHVAH